MSVEIKELDNNDRAGLRDILKISFDTLRTLDDLELDCYIDGQQHPFRWYVARTKSGRLVGCVNASIRFNEGYINSLSVREGFRGRGIGKMLIQKCCKFLKSLGCESVFLYVREENLQAKTFYEKLGFVNCGLTKSQTLEDVFLMRKKI